MAQCKNCGNEYEGRFCPECGTPENAVPAAGGNEDHITTVGEWFCWSLLIYCLPLAGVIIMLCCAKGRSAKNYAKLQLIMGIVIAVLVIGVLILAVAVPSVSGFMKKN